MSDNEHEIEVETNNTDLDISTVYEHLNVAKPEQKKENMKDVIIPEEVKKEDIEEALGVHHEEDEDKGEEIDLDVETGDGSNLDISPVYEHLNVAKPKPKEEKKNIIIPK